MNLQETSLEDLQAEITRRNELRAEISKEFSTDMDSFDTVRFCLDTDGEVKIQFLENGDEHYENIYLKQSDLPRLISTARAFEAALRQM